MFAVILSGAKQFIVKEGDVIRVEKLDAEVGKSYTFEKVLLVSKDGKEVEVGTPFLSNKVEGMVKEQGKADKILVFKMKAKKNYKRTYGHRQPYTEVEITKIS
jgi:large subunit ribosomal protein L21